MKSVFFIGGTSYSGSTFFDMILANDPRGFSCGEVHALFRPYREHHYNPVCGCGDKGCDIWPRVRKRGVERLYESLFEYLPNVDFVIDSSKDPLWIDRQARLCQKRGIDVRHVLIWKAPAKMAASCEKRGHGHLWAKKWIAYLRLYVSLIDDFVACPYKALATESDALEAVCRHLGIECFEGKQEYWNKKHHTLFGNTSAKIHTREPGTERYAAEAKHLNHRIRRNDNDLSRVHRSIHYESHESVGIPVEVERERHGPMVNAIVRILESRDVRADNHGIDASAADLAGVRATALEVRIRKIMGWHALRNLRRLTGVRRSD